MIEALAIGLGGATILSLVAILYLVYALRDSTTDQRASNTSEMLAVQGRLVAETLRDGYKAQAESSAKEAKEVRAQLVAAQAAANAARKELVDRVQKEIVAGTPGDAARIVDELLAQPIVPAAPPGAGTAAADHGDAVAAAVQPAPAADAGGAGRGTGR